jgi:hypothetical protein
MSGIVQLVARGPEDEHLTGNPDTSYFKTKFTKYTQFSSAVLRQNIEGNPTADGMSTITIQRKGDLLNYMYLVASDSTGLVTNINWSANVIDRVQLWVGYQMIDEQDSIWSNNLEPVLGATSPSQKRLGPGVSGTSTGYNSSSFYPLKFFFCKNWESSLPLVAMQFHDVTLRIFWSKNLNIAPGGVSSASKYSQLTYSLWSNYIYIDQVERKLISEKPQKILITQVQRQLIPSVGNQMELYFSNPVKYLTFQSNSYSTVYATGKSLNMKVQINGVDAGEMASLLQWVDVPQYYSTPHGYSASVSNVAIVPFCMNTASFHPTGTLNFSRLATFRIVTPDDQKVINLALTDDNTNPPYVYAVNYNFLRIENGLGSLLYFT